MGMNEAGEGLPNVAAVILCQFRQNSVCLIIQFDLPMHHAARIA